MSCVVPHMEYSHTWNIATRGIMYHDIKMYHAYMTNWKHWTAQGSYIKHTKHKLTHKKRIRGLAFSSSTHKSCDS